MVDFVNKIVSILLIFVMFVLAPVLYAYSSNYSTGQRLVLNDVTTFLDKMSDKGEINDEDMQDFYASINSHGFALDVVVQKFSKTIITDAKGNLKTEYIASDDVMEQFLKDDTLTTVQLDKGDILKVHVDEVNISKGRRFIYLISGIDNGALEFSMADVIK